jgi:hypothetical protein
VNDVLGSLVLAHALAQGSQTTGGQAPGLLATYGRQPFLWRFFQRLVTDASLVSGDQLSYLLGSFWSDDSLGTPQAKLAIVPAGDGTGLLTYNPSDNGKPFRILPPIVLRREVRNLVVELPTEEVEIRGWPGTDAPVCECVGETAIHARTLRFEVDRLQVGQLGRPSSCRLESRQVEGDHRLNIEVHENSTLMVAGVLAGRYPWDTVATTRPEGRPDDPVWDLLSDCAQRLPGVLPVVVYDDFQLTDDPRVEWARRHGDLFPRLLRALVAHGYAVTRSFPSKGDTPKMRIRPSQPWASLKAAYESGADVPLRDLLRSI